MDDKPSQASRPTAGITNSDEKPFPWSEVLSAVWLHRKRILFFVVGVTLITFGITFLISPLYTAQTSILPELTKEKTLGLAGLASLAEATGLNIGETPVSKLYPTIVQSERILRGVIYHKYKTNEYTQPVSLVECWEISAKNENEQFEKSLKKLRQRLEVNFDMRLGTVTIAVEMEESQLAADVANQITSELDDYTRTKRRTNATLQRDFIEKRMQEVKQQLEESEITLKEFRERNRRVSDSPQLMMEQERLAREVQINSTLFIELKKQFEIAKIEEIKNIPIINVLDAARPPVKKSYPKRSFAAVLALVLSFVVSAGFAGFSERGRKTLKVLQLTFGDNRLVSVDTMAGKTEERDMPDADSGRGG